MAGLAVAGAVHVHHKMHHVMHMLVWNAGAKVKEELGIAMPGVTH